MKEEESTGFSVQGLTVLASRLNEDPSSLDQDWRDAFNSGFELSVAEKQFLESCPAELHQELQRRFQSAAEEVRRGGRVNLKILRDLSDKTHGLYLVLPEPGSDAAVSTLMIRIICCDANCRNWHWCWSRP